MTTGRLILVATPIGNLGDLAPRAAQALAEADIVCCEDTRRTGRLLEHAGVTAQRLLSLHGHNEVGHVDLVLDELAAGHDVALVSDAGMPLISDPGERLVRAAVDVGATVTVVPGPTAGVAALVLSGLSTERWRFEGFLPRKGRERHARLAELAASPVPVICYEAPHRLRETLADLERECGPNRPVTLARELTKLHEEIWRGELGAARAWADEGEPRGEFVIVLDGAPSPVPPDEAALHAAMVRLLTGGLGRRDAVTAAEVLLGVSHRDAYDAALRVAEDTSPSKSRR